MAAADRRRRRRRPPRAKARRAPRRRARAGRSAAGPADACGARRSPDQRTLWVARADTGSPVGVRIGITDGIFTEIDARNIHEGDQIVTDVEGVGDDKKQPPGGNAMRRMF